MFKNKPTSNFGAKLARLVALYLLTSLTSTIKVLSITLGLTPPDIPDNLFFDILKYISNGLLIYIIIYGFYIYKELQKKQSLQIQKDKFTFFETEELKSKEM